MEPGLQEVSTLYALLRGVQLLTPLVVCKYQIFILQLDAVDEVLQPLMKSMKVPRNVRIDEVQIYSWITFLRSMSEEI